MSEIFSIVTAFAADSYVCFHCNRHSFDLNIILIHDHVIRMRMVDIASTQIKTHIRIKKQNQKKQQKRGKRRIRDGKTRAHKININVIRIEEKNF